MSANIDGAEWSAEPYFSIAERGGNGQNEMTILGFIGDPMSSCPYPNWCENLGLIIYPISDEAGRYATAQGTGYVLMDGDQIMEEYDTVPGTGWVEFSSITDERVSGTFEVTFVNEDDSADTLRFTDGEFVAHRRARN